MMMTEQHLVATRVKVGQPCEDDSIDAVDYERKFMAAIEEGLAELDRGEFVTHEEIKKEFSSWSAK